MKKIKISLLAGILSLGVMGAEALTHEQLIDALNRHMGGHIKAAASTLAAETKISERTALALLADYRKTRNPHSALIAQALAEAPPAPDEAFMQEQAARAAQHRRRSPSPKRVSPQHSPGHDFIHVPPPPPPPGMGFVPPPPPPPPPGLGGAPHSAQGGRPAFLAGIEGGLKLKKTTTHDRSGPVLDEEAAAAEADPFLAELRRRQAAKGGAKPAIPVKELTAEQIRASQIAAAERQAKAKEEAAKKAAREAEEAKRKLDELKRK